MSSTLRVRYRGIEFELDLDAVREAIALHQLKDCVTLDQFAKESGVSRMSVWRLLGGQSVSLSILGRVLRALELNPEVILRSSGRGPSQPSPGRAIPI